MFSAKTKSSAVVIFILVTPITTHPCPAFLRDRIICASKPAVGCTIMCFHQYTPAESLKFVFTTTGGRVCVP